MDTLKIRLQTYEVSDATENASGTAEINGNEQGVWRPPKQRQRRTSARILLDSGKNHATPSTCWCRCKSTALNAAPSMLDADVKKLLFLANNRVETTVSERLR